MSQCHLDHLVIAAATLEAGVAYLEEELGVTVPYGGKHPLMGTHKCLMRLGKTSFLEIIAVDPDAKDVGHPRWFALDDPGVQASIAHQPRLHTWVCRTADLTDAIVASPIATGPSQEARRGDLEWQITIFEDGSLPEDGLFPTLLQWPESLGPNGPASRMADLGCNLEKLELLLPDPGHLSNALDAIGFDGPVEFRKADKRGFAAHIRTPDNLVALS